MFFKTYAQPHQPQVKNSVLQTPLPYFKQIQPGIYCFSFTSAGNSGSFPDNPWQVNFTPFRQQKHYPVEAPERIPGTNFVRAGGQPNDAYSQYDLPVYCFT